MATTFTGLKLQGQLGKFGRIEISDISAYVELPDGKVLSGTEWGNLLLWDGGFIKVEISKKGKKYCHNVSMLYHTCKRRRVSNSSSYTTWAGSLVAAYTNNIWYNCEQTNDV